MKTIKIKFFASLREKIGDDTSLELKQGESVNSLLEKLIEDFPKAKEILVSSRIANGNAILKPGELLDIEKEIGVLPPASGG